MSLMINNVELFFFNVRVGHLYIFFGKLFNWIFGLFLNLIFFFFAVKLYEFFLFCILVTYQIYGLQVFSPKICKYFLFSFSGFQ